MFDLGSPKIDLALKPQDRIPFYLGTIQQPFLLINTLMFYRSIHHNYKFQIQHLKSLIQFRFQTEKILVLNMNFHFVIIFYYSFVLNWICQRAGLLLKIHLHSSSRLYPYDQKFLLLIFCHLQHNLMQLHQLNISFLHCILF